MSIAGYRAIYHESGNMIAQLGELHGADERATLVHCGNAEANARLISAAPELLEALWQLMLAPDSPASKQRAMDAYDKATGQTL